MPPFEISRATMFRVYDWLGYSYIGNSPVVPSYLTEEEAQESERVLVTILDELDSTYEQIVELLPDSLAVKLDSLVVDYRQQHSMLRAHGRRLVNRLSNMTHLPIRQSYFSGSEMSRFA